MSQISRLYSSTWVSGAVLNAADLNAEFDQLLNESNTQDSRITSLETAAMTIAGAKTFSSNIIVDGLTERTAANGIYFDGGSVRVKDGKLTLNADTVTAPTTHGTITVERGSSPDVSIRFNETTHLFQFTNDGSNYLNMGSSNATRQVFTASGTWVKPTGCAFAFIQVQGGGGGGGGSETTDNKLGGGGAAGALAEAYIDVSGIASSTVTVGAGGANGTSTTSGGAGGNSSWADGTNTITASGGPGGSVGSAPTVATGSTGTTAGAGILTARTVTGQSGTRGGNDTQTTNTGRGGSSLFGGGGVPDNNAVGEDGRGKGSGGAGGHRSSAAVSRAGGSGATGLVVVYEFY